MGIYHAWEMSAAGVPNKPHENKRLGDFMRFLAETQRGYYTRREQQARQHGYKAVMLTTAWKAGGAGGVAANLWDDDTPGYGAISRHTHVGGNASGDPYNIHTGPVKDATHLDQPGDLLMKVGTFQVEDKPFVFGEWTDAPPNQWKAEGAPIVAMYGMGLQGWDSSYHFAGSRTYMGNGWPDLSAFATETPHVIGQFPALSLAVREGHFAEGAIAAARRIPLGDAFSGVDPLTQPLPGSAYERQPSVPGVDLPPGTLATPLPTMAIGRVTTKVADNQPRSAATNWADHWDTSAKVIRSNTGQLVWDYGKKVITARSPKTQGVIGFAAGGTYDLPAVTVKVHETPFVSLVMTALDGKPLDQSRHILVTAMARDKQMGAGYTADGKQLYDTGSEPLLLEPVQATLTFKGAGLSSVKVVDVYGVPTATNVQRNGNTFNIDGRYATYYYEVKRDAAPPVGPVTYQAEAATIVGARVTKQFPGYTGTGYVDYLHASGDYIEWKVDAPVAGNYTAIFRHAHGGRGDRPLRLNVNGAIARAKVSFLPTGAWSTWKNVFVPVRLTAGVNVVRLSAIGASGTNIDSMTVKPAFTQPAAAVRANVSGFGSAAAAGFQSSSATRDFIESTFSTPSQDASDDEGVAPADTTSVWRGAVVTAALRAEGKSRQAVSGRGM
jgi:hypothetical protein